MGTQEDIFHWDCGGKTSTFHRLEDGLVRNTNLKGAVKSDRDCELVKNVNRIFSLVTRARCDTEHLQDLFDGFCQHLALLRLSSDKAVRVTAAREIRLCVLHIEHVARSRHEESLDCETVLDIVKNIVTHMESVADFTSVQAMSPELFHTWLEVRWAMIKVCEVIPAHDNLISCPDIAPGASWGHQLISATVLDLFVMASQKCSQFDVTHKNISQLSIFQCPCVEELWLCLFSLCQSKDVDFWRLIESLNRNTEDQMEIDETEYDHTDLSLVHYEVSRVGDSVWLMLLSSLTSILGPFHEANDKNQAQSFYRKLTKQFFADSSQRPSESKLRMFLNVMVNVSSKIGPSLDILSELWKFFSQITSINSSCRLKTMTLEGSTSIPATTSSWLDLVLTLGQTQDPSSFSLFSLLVSLAITSWTNNAATKEVKVLMGRISVKINPNKLAQLNEYGVFHLTTLLLSIASLVPEDQSPQQIAGQLLKVSQESFVMGCTTNTFQTVVKSCLTFCQLSVHKGISLNTSGLADQISECLEAMVARLKASQSDINLKRLCHDLVKIYTECLTEIADTSLSLATDEDSLLQPWLAVYLRICTVNEISSLLTPFSTLLTRARMTLGTSMTSAMPTTEQVEEMRKLRLVVAKLWSVIYPAVRELSVTLTAPAEVGALAADFIILRAESEARRDTEAGGGSLEEMVKHFTQNKAVSPDTASSVLHTIAHNPGVQAQVSRASLTQSLAFCSMTAVAGSAANHQVREAWQCLYGESGTDPGTDVAVLVIRGSLGSPGLLASMCGLCSDVGAWRGEAAVLRQYQVASWLVLHAGDIIHNPSNFSNHLTNIIGNLLTPNGAFSDSWNLSLSNKKAIRNSISFFLKGIITHRNFEADKFLSRKLTEIIKIYLPRYEATNHPLLGLLKSPGLVDSVSLNLKVANMTVETVAKLAKDNLKRPQLVMSCVKFLENSLISPQSFSAEVIVTKALNSLLEIISFVEEKNVKNNVIAVLKILFSETAPRRDNLISSINERLLVFVQNNLAFNSERVFNTLRVISVLNTRAIADILKNLYIYVENVERKRGSGRDIKLRRALDELQKAVN